MTLPRDRFGIDLPKPDTTTGFGSPKLRREQRSVGLRLADGAKIEGSIHIPPFTRPLDLLNSREDAFIAITCARVLEPGSSEWQDLSFVALNKSQIIRMYEMDPIVGS